MARRRKAAGSSVACVGKCATQCRWEGEKTPAHNVLTQLVTDVFKLKHLWQCPRQPYLRPLIVA